MPRHIVFLRAVNVGKRQLPMAAAREYLSGNGFTQVESYIQTGNLLVTSAMRSTSKVERTVGELLSDHAGFDVVAIARTPAELSALVARLDATPPALSAEAGRYVSFCTTEPERSRVAELEGWQADGERARVIGKDVLMELTVPFNQVTLTGARIERILGVPGTARNLTVVRAIAQKWGS